MAQPVALPTHIKGNYDAVQNSDGTWNVLGISAMVPHDVIRRAADGSTVRQNIGPEWMGEALKRNRARFDRDGYMGPAHINHSPTPSMPNRKKERVSFFRLKGLSPINYEGERHQGLTLDLIGVPEKTYQEIREGKLPYLSVEVLDFDNFEVDSVALMAADVPHFRFAPVTIRSERRAPAMAANTHYQATGTADGAILYEACPCEDCEDMTMPNPLTGGKMAAPDEELPMEDEALDLGLEEEGAEEVAGLPVEIPEEAPVEQPDEMLMGEDEELEEVELADEELIAMGRKAMMAAGGHFDAGSPESLYSIIGQMQTRLAAQDKQMAALKAKERARAKATQRAKVIQQGTAHLASAGYNASRAAKDVGAMYDAGGIPGVRQFLKIQTANPQPQGSGLPSVWEDAGPNDGADNPGAVAQYSAEAQQACAMDSRAAKLAAQETEVYKSWARSGYYSAAELAEQGRGTLKAHVDKALKDKGFIQ